jgi:hypothetical protein
MSLHGVTTKNNIVSFILLQFILRRPFSNYDYMASDERVISEWWIGKDLEENGRGLILRYNPSIFLKELRKTTKTVTTAGRWTEIWTRDIPNTKQEC